MANVLDNQLLQDGECNVVQKYTATLTTDLSAVTLIDAATIAKTAMGQPSRLRVMQIDYVVADGLSVQMLWDGGTQKILAELTGRGNIKNKHFGGFVSDAGTPTGKIILNTTGAATDTGTGGANFTLVVQYRKQFLNT